MEGHIAAAKAGDLAAWQALVDIGAGEDRHEGTVRAQLVEAGACALVADGMKQGPDVQELALRLAREITATFHESNGDLCAALTEHLPLRDQLRFVAEGATPGVKEWAACGLRPFPMSTRGSQALVDVLGDVVEVYDRLDWKVPADATALRHVVGALQNLSQFEDGRQAMIDAGIPDRMLPLMQSKNPDRAPVDAGSIIANLLGNVENHPMLKADKTLVRMMVDCLAKARKGALYFGAKWRPSAALQSLASLAVSDSNKKVLLSEGVAKVMLSVLKDTKSPPDAKAELYAVKVLAELAFEKELAKLAKGADKIMAEAARSAQLPETQDIAKMAIFTHEVKTQKQQHSSAEGFAKSHLQKRQSKRGSSRRGSAPENHVMLSYCWKQQETMLAIKERLEAAGITVWMDVEQMSGSTLEAMAEAVEDASLVVMGLSPEYKDSQACRTEGEYAYNLRKPIVPVKVKSGYVPNGWLGAMIGNKLYFEAPSEKELEAQADSIIKEIKRIAQRGPAISHQTDKGASAGDVASLRNTLQEAEAEIRRLRAKERQAHPVAAQPPTEDTRAVMQELLAPVVAMLGDISDRLGRLEAQHQPAEVVGTAEDAE